MSHTTKSKATRRPGNEPGLIPAKLLLEHIPEIGIGAARAFGLFELARAEHQYDATRDAVPRLARVVFEAGPMLVAVVDVEVDGWTKPVLGTVVVFIEGERNPLRVIGVVDDEQFFDEAAQLAAGFAFDDALTGEHPDAIGCVPATWVNSFEGASR